jgi:signal transduction histidine kinase
MRTDFVSHVSHELRTPLAAIVGSIKLILDGHAGEITETQNRLLNIVERESAHLMQLINDLLDLAKLEAGRTKIEKEDVSLEALIAEAVESMQPLAQSQSIHLTAESDGLGSPLSCDPSLIRQVLHNLIGNAIKFTPAGGSIRTVAKTGPAFAEVKVIDTGIGIPRDKWEAVFNKFEQLGSHKGPVKGTGLGLAICRQIVERHGGRISVESEEGVGSTFRFTLPRGEPVVEVKAVTTKDEPCVSPTS